jgi:hypothetical protein
VTQKSWLKNSNQSILAIDSCKIFSSLRLSVRYTAKATEKLTLAHIDAFMTSQSLRFPSAAVKQSRDDKADRLSEYVQNIERSAPNHAWIANTVNMDGKKVKKVKKAVNTTDVSAAEGASTVTAVESDSGTGSAPRVIAGQIVINQINK